MSSSTNGAQMDAPAPRNPNLVALLGDSRADQVTTDHAINRNKSGYNHFNTGNSLAGQRAKIVYFGGNSGDRTDQVLARLQDSIASGAGTGYLHAGVNTIAANYPTAATSGASAAADLNTIIDAWVAAGMTAIVVLDPGFSAASPAQIAQLQIMNETVREHAEVAAGRVILVDLPSVLWNPLAGQGVLGFKPGYLLTETLGGQLTQTHESNLGAEMAGLTMAQALTIAMPPLPDTVSNMFERPSANSVVNLLDNSLFNSTAAAGTSQAGVVTSGAANIPAFFSIHSQGNATCTVGAPRPSTSPNGAPGFEVPITCTFTASGDSIRIGQDAALANWSPGDILQARAEVTLQPGAVNCAGVELYLQANGDLGSFTAMDMAADAGHGPVSGAGYTRQLKTPALLIPNYGAKSWVTSYVRALACGPGSATFMVRAYGVKKRSAL